MIARVKNFMRRWLGFRDIYYIHNEKPYIKEEFTTPFNNDDIARVVISGLSIDSGCVISIDGKKYMVVNSVLEVMDYKDNGGY